MGRIRTIKPEFFRHEALFAAEQSTRLPLRLAFIGLWCRCDRDGRFRWRPGELKLDILPYDDVDFSRILDALAAHGFIIAYENSGGRYGHIPSWHKHQRINHREIRGEIPGPDDAGSRLLTEGPKKIVQGRTNSTAVCPSTHAVQKKEETDTKEVSPKAHLSKMVQAVFAHWQTVMQRPNAKLDRAREAIINKALQAGYSVAQLGEAIQGCRLTPYNMGTNERGQRYDGLQIILRDADQIDRFIGNFHSPPQQQSRAKQHTNANVSALQNWMQKKIKPEEEDNETP